MGLSVGIVGLPNVGKSTIFNVLTRKQQAASANYPFCTIEPNRAVVPVPDMRLDRVAETAASRQVIHATVNFVDIAGLVKGASRGEGLGNKFLSHIRETDAILQIVRCFDDGNVVHVNGSIDPVRDIETIETEMIMADLQMVEARFDKFKKTARNNPEFSATLPALEALLAHLDKGKMASSFEGRASDSMEPLSKEFRLLTDKKIICCCNVDEQSLITDNDHVKAIKHYAAERGMEAIKICAKMEEELNGLSDKERCELLKAYGIKESGLDQIMRSSYHTLGLISYFTQGPKETRAWTICKGQTASKAAGVIHTDFERGFIRAQVISFKDFLEKKGKAACQEAGLLRTEGREYIVDDGDIMEFLFNV